MPYLYVPMTITLCKVALQNNQCQSALQQLLLPEPFFLNQLLESIEPILRHVELLHFLAVIVEDDELWMVMRNEIELQPHIRVSVARVQHEAPDLSQPI